MKPDILVLLHLLNSGSTFMRWWSPVAHWFVGGLLLLSVFAFIVRQSQHTDQLAAWGTEFGSPIGIDGELFLETIDEEGNVYVTGSFGFISGMPVSSPALFANGEWKSFSIENDSFRIDRLQNMSLDEEGNLRLIGSFLTEAEQSVYGTAILQERQEWQLIPAVSDRGYGRITWMDQEEAYDGDCSWNSAGYFGNGLWRWTENEWQYISGVFDCVFSLFALDGKYLLVEGGSPPFDWKVIRDGVVIEELSEPPPDKLTAVSQGILYGVRENKVVQWNGSDWHASAWNDLPGSAHPDIPIHQMTVGQDENLIVLRIVQTEAMFNMVFEQWDGQAWTTIYADTEGYEFRGYVPSVKFLPHPTDGIYVSGIFRHADRLDVSTFVRFKDGEWSPLLSTGMGLGPVKGSITEMATDGSRLYVSGSFNQGGAVPMSNLGMLENGRWSSPGELGVIALSTLETGDDGTLYAGGIFLIPGWEEAHRAMGRWDGVSWRPFDEGITLIGGRPSIYDIEMGPDGTIYVGGIFDEVNGQPASGLARWKDGAWQAIEIPFTAMPYFRGFSTNISNVLACPDQNIYVTTNNLAPIDVPDAPLFKWDGATWTTIAHLSSPTARRIRVEDALCTEEGLYIGGIFNQVDSLEVGHIAFWDGTQWSGLGRGAWGGVQAMTLNEDGHLVVGGRFAGAGEVASRNLAIWDGSEWSKFGLGTELEGSGTVYTLSGVNGLASVSADSFYIGGLFFESGFRELDAHRPVRFYKR